MRHDTYESIHDLLKQIIVDDASVSEASAKEQLWEQIRDSQGIFRLLFDNWFNANWFRYEPEVKEIITEIPGKPPVIGHSVTVMRKRQGSTRETKFKRKIVAKKIIMEKTHVILMSLPMPNGKQLRDCTGAECIKFGGWFASIGKNIKASEKVGKQLTETDLQNLYMRNAA
jgi:hypothetical protein